MKLALALTAAAVLSACAMPDAERRLAVDIALAQIEAYNAAGYDPLNLDKDEQLHLNTICLTAPVFFPLRAAEIADYCEVIKEAAA